MISTRRLRRPATPWLRVLAVVCAGMILLLSAAAASPALHAWLHSETPVPAAALACEHAHTQAGAQDDSSDSDHAREREHAHECAITLFSHGVTLASLLVATLDHLSAASDTAPAPHDRVTPPGPRHLRPQPQAPPIA